MEWLRNFIAQHTGEDGKIDMEALIKDVNKAAPEHVIPKDQYNEVAQERNQLRATVKERDQQLENLQKAGSVDDLKAQIDTLKAENKAVTEKHKADMDGLIINSAIDKALEKASHSDLLKLKINKEGLKIEGEGSDRKVSGLDEVITSLKKEYKDFFPQEKKGKDPVTGKSIDPSGKKQSEMSYEEFVASLDENA